MYNVEGKIGGDLDFLLRGWEYVCVFFVFIKDNIGEGFFEVWILIF